MVSMEVNDRMIPLVPVHVDDDPVERADPRHTGTVAEWTFLTTTLAGSGPRHSGPGYFLDDNSRRIAVKPGEACLRMNTSPQMKGCID